MILYFKNSKGERREIGRPDTYDEVNEIIDKFLDDHKYKSYYIIVRREDDNPFIKADKTKIRYVFDVGSHTEFFVLDSFGKEIEELKEL